MKEHRKHPSAYFQLKFYTKKARVSNLSTPRCPPITGLVKTVRLANELHASLLQKARRIEKKMF